MEDVVEKLKEIIEDKGPGYLSAEPYKVYKKLLKDKAADKKTAGALLMLFVSGIHNEVKPETEFAFLSKLIQKDCCFNKKMADKLAAIVLSLYSQENEDEWERNDMAGFESFKKEELSIKWKGSAIWKTHGGGVDCYYEADIVIKATKALVVNEELSQALHQNPFLKTKDVGIFYEKSLKEYLDYEFEDFCTCDDYYQPVVEDFEIEYCVEEWCKKNGFKLISCEGDGSDSGYEPDSVRKWLKY